MLYGNGIIYLMKYAIWIVLIIMSLALSKLLLWLVNPNDPEGSNLLVTTVAGAIVFIPLSLVYLLVTRKRKAKA